jgi:hypothetical protein
MSGTGRHREAVSTFSNGIDHGIATLTISVTHLYHAMHVEMFMVSAISLD